MTKKVYVIQAADGLLHIVQSIKKPTEVWVDWATSHGTSHRVAVDTNHLKELLEEMEVKRFYFQPSSFAAKLHKTTEL